MENKTEIRNQMLQQYLATSTNYAICIDITSLGLYGELFLAVDTAARNIVGHCYSSQTIDTQQVCQTIKEFARKREFLPQIQIIHSDRGSVFKNEQYYQCLNELKIKISRGAAAAHQNQVVERLNRSIKEIIRKEIVSGWKKGMQDPLKQVHLDLDAEQMAKIIKQSIEAYHRKPHRSLYGLTPDQMEEALFRKHKDKHPTDIVLLTENDMSERAQQAQAYKMQVVREYAGDWVTFFLDWKQQQQEWQKDLKQTLMQAVEEAKEREQVALKQNKTLYEQYLEVQKQLEYMHQRAVEEQREKEEKQARKLKKQQAKKKDLRQTVTPQDFEFILSLVKGRAGAKERRRLALTILYLTGLRVSNLLLFQVSHVKQLMEKGHTRITLIKGGEKRFPLHLSPKGRHILRACMPDFIKLSKEKREDQPVFSPLNNPNKSLPRVNFDKELNSILAKASEKLEKHIRTHSFRATIITDLLKSTPIDEVKDIIGHKAISSTLEYKRTRLQPSQVIKILKRRELQSPRIKAKTKVSRRKSPGLRLQED
jgi:site-specific recombinase XerD